MGSTTLQSIKLDKLQKRYQLGCIILYSFLLTFILTRVIVFLLIADKIPCVFLQIGGYHIHHYIYGIIILTATAGFVILRQPQGMSLMISACLYGVSSALIYDEFALLIYLLADSYVWHLSWDIVTIVVIIATLVTYIPIIKARSPSDTLGAIVLLGFLILYGTTIYFTSERLTRLRGDELYYLEKNGGNACINNFYFKNN